MADADRLTLSLSTGGDVVIKLRPDLAPGHVQRITDLASSGFYDNVVFHRVIPGFMAQGGDPTGTGYHGSDLPNLKAEFSATPHKRGAVSMARSQNPDSANSQFFIVTEDSPFLDRRRRRHQAEARPRARPRPAHYRACQQGLLRRSRLPPRDPRLHGPRRRSDRDGLSRL